MQIKEIVNDLLQTDADATIKDVYSIYNLENAKEIENKAMVIKLKSEYFQSMKNKSQGDYKMATSR